MNKRHSTDTPVPNTLVIIPTKREYEIFVQHLFRDESSSVEESCYRCTVRYCAQLNTYVAMGGLGKTQFGIQTQYIVDRLPNVASIICIGAAGALRSNLKSSDVVVATETVEHDIRKFNRSMVPRFSSSDQLLNRVKTIDLGKLEFDVLFGPIASGDEDVMSRQRSLAIQELTGSIAVAWEGAGGARAAKFNNLDYIEIRGITDFANDAGESDFYANLESALVNTAIVVKSCLL